MNTANSSIRYAEAAAKNQWDRYNRNRIFIEECQKYESVLETGCSTGFLSRMISANGSRVVGIEIDPEAATVAEFHCSRVFVLDLNSQEWMQRIGEQFDLITFGDVLEHLARPAEVLRHSTRLLKSGGRVLICLPNIAHWSVRLRLLFGQFNYRPTGILDHTHLRFFTLVSAREMMREAGYRIVWFRPIIGGRLNNYMPWLWQWLANLVPGLFAFQMMFLIEATETSPKPLRLSPQPES